MALGRLTERTYKHSRAHTRTYVWHIQGSRVFGCITRFLIEKVRGAERPSCRRLSGRASHLLARIEIDGERVSEAPVEIKV